MKDPDLNLDFFKETLAEGDERAVRRALEHMITWHETYRGGVVGEFGISAKTSPDLIQLCTSWVATACENDPGFTTYRRKVGPWQRMDPKPELYRGQQVDILAITPQES